MSSCFASVWLIGSERKMSGATGFNESENSYLHKNAKSTIVALSGENGWVPSMVSLGGSKQV